MTLAKLIKQQTGWDMPTFAKRKGYSIHTLKGWSLPIPSGPIKNSGKRIPSDYEQIKLAKILEVDVEVIKECVTRRKV